MAGEQIMILNENANEGGLKDTNTNDDPEPSDKENSSQNEKRARKIDRIKRRCYADVDRQKRRENGENYDSTKRKNGLKATINREARKIGPRCAQKKCKTSNTINCRHIPETERQKIFDSFWSMSWSEKRTCVRTLVQKYEPERRTKPSQKTSTRERTWSYRYYLKANGRLNLVCKSTFINTLNIGDTTIKNWLNLEKDPIYLSSTIQRKKVNNTSNEKKRKILKNYLSSLSTVPSHYGRGKGDFKYLERSFRFKTDVFRHYKKYCNLKKSEPFSWKTFKIAFDNAKLRLHKLQIDDCDFCTKHIVGKDITEEQLNAHKELYKEARNEKDLDKKFINENQDTIIINTDTQKVLQCPVLFNGASYFKSKVSVHNHTFIDLQTKKVRNFLWNESNGGVVSSCYATIYFYYLEELILERINSKFPIKYIILWSDSCCYQNRNVNLSNALLHLAIKYDIEIIQKYLVPGHTWMEIDAVHANIEKKLRNRKIYDPKQFVKIMGECGSLSNFNYNINRVQVSDLQITDDSSPEPVPKIMPREKKEYNYIHFEITHIENFRYWRNFSKLNYYPNIRPVNSSIRVLDFRAIRYNSNGIYFKTNFHEDFRPVDGTILNINYMEKNLPQLYPRRIKLSSAKSKSILELLPYIPKKFHEFYKRLPK